MRPELNLGRIDEGALERSPPVRIGFIVIGGITVAAVAVTAGLTAAGAHAMTGASGAGAVLAALGRGIVVGVPLAVSLYACRRPAHAQFGRVLLLVSSLWFLASLSTSSSSFLYSVGRIFGWVAEVGIVYAVLAFPDGRLRDRVDRSLVAVSIVLTSLLYLPTALLVARYPSPSPWSSCTATCPHNAFMAVTHQPALIDGAINPVRDLLTVIVFLIVAVRLTTRIRDANSLLRRTLTPVLVVAIGRLLVFAVGIGARRASADSALTLAAAWTVAFALPALAAGFLLGLARWHVFVTAGIQAVNARLREMPGPEEVRELLARAFDDPGLEIASWSSRRRRWIDAAGHTLNEPGKDSGRHLTEVRDGPRPAIAIVHDGALTEDYAFVESAATAASVAFASDRVAARTAGLIRELRASRARIVAAADSERRRIERDLHDGAQQHLVGLCIHLELAAEAAEQDHPSDAAELRKLVAEVEEALEEIRSLTHGIYPAMLVEGGLEVAVRSAARRSPVPATVEAKDLSEYPDEIIAAVYFCCAEALQNVAKHAREARSARVELREANRVLSFSVSDDGPGLNDNEARVGAGMLNMRDRMATVGGKLTVQSRPGQGTRISGRIPLAAIDRPERAHDDGRAAPRTWPVRQREHKGP